MTIGAGIILFFFFFFFCFLFFCLYKYKYILKHWEISKKYDTSLCAYDMCL